VVNIKDRAYWFFYNLIRFLVNLVFMPLSWATQIIHGFYIVFFVTDGSQELVWPWETWNFEIWEQEKKSK